jgi:hypothetical protein
MPAIHHTLKFAAIRALRWPALLKRSISSTSFGAPSATSPTAVQLTAGALPGWSFTAPQTEVRLKRGHSREWEGGATNRDRKNCVAHIKQHGLLLSQHRQSPGRPPAKRTVVGHQPLPVGAPHDQSHLTGHLGPGRRDHKQSLKRAYTVRNDLRGQKSDAFGIYDG